VRVDEPVDETRGRRSYLQVPDDWKVVEQRHVGRFVTRETFARPDGTLFHWSSRAHRKRGRGATTGSTWWAPRAIAWWIAVLFIIGSLCFAIGPLPFYLSWVGYKVDTATFFIGSLFFTSAALLQYIEVVVAPRAVDVSIAPASRRLLLGIEPARVDWWAASVQFVGTLFFNVTTFSAFLTDLTTQQQHRIVWTPDALGSICFLVASWLAYAEVGHRVWSWQPHRRSWRIAALNLVGSIAFGVSAVASFVRPASGDPISLFWTNFGTFIGAICFLSGAVLLMPERTDPDG
jgi:hypothetical protein